MKHWDQVAIVGVGLIGGSIGMALRKSQLAAQVIGVGRNLTRLQQAQQLGALDRYALDLKEGVRNAELVIVCTPVDTIVALVRQIAASAESPMLITDAGSTKENIVSQLADLPAPASFVGSHPMAGSEKTGVISASPELFVDRNVVMTTPPENALSSPQASAQVREFWESLGAKVIEMDAALHDVVVAAVSHLPHVVASALAAATPAEHLPLSATGWSDTTRVAGGDAELWRQILMDNQGPVLQALDNFAKVLDCFRSAIQNQDASQLLSLLEAGKKHRDIVGS